MHLQRTMDMNGQGHFLLMFIVKSTTVKKQYDSISLLQQYFLKLGFGKILISLQWTIILEHLTWLSQLFHHACFVFLIQLFEVSFLQTLQDMSKTKFNLKKHHEWSTLPFCKLLLVESHSFVTRLHSTNYAYGTQLQIFKNNFLKTRIEISAKACMWKWYIELGGTSVKQVR